MYNIKVSRETEKYKVTKVYESKVFCIRFVEDKSDKTYDRVQFIKYGNEYRQPEILTIYRYEDEKSIQEVERVIEENSNK